MRDDNPDRSSSEHGTCDAAAAADGLATTTVAERSYREDDNRGLYQPASRYTAEYQLAQRYESFYIFCLLGASLIALACLGLGFVDRLFAELGVPGSLIESCRRFEWIAAGGLLGGTVYSAKWLYHAIAKGLWHEDRRTWRFLSPWIALGATVGIGALVESGFFHSSVGTVASQSGAKLTALGFLIGYLSDRFLAKMKDLVQVAFGESEERYKRTSATRSEDPRDP